MKRWPVSVISGGASGIGLGLAELLLRRGGRVCVLDLGIGERARARLDGAAGHRDGRWRFETADVTDEVQVEAAVQSAVEAFGRPDLGINAAGILLNRTLANTASEQFRRVVEVNLTGSFHFARALLPRLNPGGRLALIASMAGLTSSYGYSAYGASKFGVVGLATTLRYEYEPLGVGISCVCPPEVDTPMVAAERRPGQADPISLALKDVVGRLDTEPACRSILAGIDAGRWMVVPGVRSRMTLFAARHLPAGFHALTRAVIGRLMRTHGRPERGIAARREDDAP